MSTNEITGDLIATKPSTEAYRSGYDAIDFSAHRKQEPKEEQDDAPADVQEQDD